MNTGYIMRRLAWRWFPGGYAWLLHRLKKNPLKHGTETLKPQAAVERYCAAFQDCQIDIRDKRLLIFGYGGGFAVACKLLEAGAGHIVLADLYARPDWARNEALLPEYGRYLQRQNGQVLPRPEYITLSSGDVRQMVREQAIPPVDLVISSTVFEHVADVEGAVAALSGLTCPDGYSLHFIDLRDHLYSYPFEMLSFSPAVWKYVLNPVSHLNRYRLGDFRRVFSDHFSEVTIQVEKQDEPSYRKAAHKIRPEFKTGNLHEDAATYIRVMARYPRRG